MTSHNRILFFLASILQLQPGCGHGCVRDRCEDLSDEMAEPTHAHAMLQKSVHKKLTPCIDDDGVYNAYTYSNKGCAALKEMTPRNCANVCENYATIKEACCASCDACAANTNICPYSCQNPECREGAASNGGLPLTDGKCTHHCSMPYDGIRYCGSGDDYTIGPSVDCTGCAVGCPSECQSPTCVMGGSHNGGLPLTDGKCTSHCSQLIGGFRYCGSGDQYSPGGVDCSGCAAFLPQPEPCPSECQNPSCVKGSAWNGGLSLMTNGKCDQYCSPSYNGVRYCGKGGEYEQNGGVDCRGCSDTRCPFGCHECNKGSSWNGGLDLTNGVCTAYCSKPFSGERYCGYGDDYSGPDSLVCIACASGVSP